VPARLSAGDQAGSGRVSPTKGAPRNDAGAGVTNGPSVTNGAAGQARRLGRPEGRPLGRGRSTAGPAALSIVPEVERLRSAGRRSGGQRLSALARNAEVRKNPPHDHGIFNRREQTETPATIGRARKPTDRSVAPVATHAWGASLPPAPRECRRAEQCRWHVGTAPSDVDRIPCRFLGMSPAR
jgi:hypothetical protein